MSSEPTKSRRGRAERMAARSQAAVPVVRRGMAGGQFAPLAAADIPKIQAAALQVLETTGIADVDPAYVPMFLQAGCWLSDRGRMCFPSELVNSLIEATPKSVTVHGLGPAAAVTFAPGRVHVCTGGTGVNMFEGGKVRESTLADLYDVTRLADAMEHIHCCNRQLVARDVEDVAIMDVNTAYVIASATGKPFGAGVTTANSAGQVRRLMDMILGDPAAFDRAPVCWSGGTFVVSPLKAPADGQDKLEAIVRAGFPVHQVMVPQSGTTGPAPLAGTLVQALAESLFVLCFVQLLKRGHPFIIGCWPFVSDLRTGAFSGGSGEQALLMAASAQVLNAYGLPSSIAAGMCDAKLTDVQAGAEKAMTLSLATLSGATLIYSFAGMLGSIMGISPAQMVIDNEILGASLRVLRGIEVDTETLALPVIDEAAVDPGHYIAHPQTLGMMESEYLYPSMADRSSLSQWLSKPGPDMATKAEAEAARLLASHFPQHIPEDTDAAIRQSFDIRLPRERMRPA